MNQSNCAEFQQVSGTSMSSGAMADREVTFVPMAGTFFKRNLSFRRVNRRWRYVAKPEAAEIVVMSSTSSKTSSNTMRFNSSPGPGLTSSGSGRNLSSLQGVFASIPIDFFKRPIDYQAEHAVKATAPAPASSGKDDYGYFDMNDDRGLDTDDFRIRRRLAIMQVNRSYSSDYVTVLSRVGTNDIL